MVTYTTSIINISSSYLIWPLSLRGQAVHFHYIFYRIRLLCTYHFRNIRTRILNTIYRVLFSSLCLQIFIFYFGILIQNKINIYIFSAASSDKTKHSTGQSTPSGSGLHVHLAWVASGIRGHERTGRLKFLEDSLYMAKLTCGTRVRIKTRKIQNKLFLLALFKRNFLHESAWIQGWFYSHWANCEEFGRYSSFFS
jgi:hypothetical protein